MFVVLKMQHGSGKGLLNAWPRSLLERVLLVHVAVPARGLPTNKIIKLVPFVLPLHLLVMMEEDANVVKYQDESLRCSALVTSDHEE